MQISNYDRRHWGYSVLGLLAFVPVAIFMAYASRTGLFGENVWLSFGVFIALGTAVWSINLLWWRSLDDVHRQGQTNSWYWGSLFGGFTFLIWLIASNDHLTAYAAGASHMLIVQFAVFLVLYGIWKWRGRASSGGSGQ